MSNFEVLRRFGTSIYYSTMNEDMMTTLRDIAKTSRDDGLDMRPRLAGNIDREQQWLVNDDVRRDFYYQLLPHLRTFTESEDNRFQKLLIKKSEIQNNYDKMDYTFITEPWINYQKANEFNPIHSHHGQYSSVLYIDVPEEIAQENKDGKSNMTCRGQIEFIYSNDQLGSNGTHKIIPKTGDILLFDARLKHCVYPFISDVERISMSFNVNVNFME